MQYNTSKISFGTILIEPALFGDHRGFFSETFSRCQYADFGIDVEFVQDNHSLPYAIGTLQSIVEKPDVPPSNYAVTGLYFVDVSAPYRAKLVKPSYRGKLESTSLLENYLSDDSLNVEKMGRCYAWLDTGTHASLLDASNFVRTLTERQGLQNGSPDELAYQMNWITEEQLNERVKLLGKSKYGQHLIEIGKNK